MKRAVTDEQKQCRRNEVLSAFNSMLQEMPLQEITFTKLSAELGWARGNIYRYFQSMDEIAFVWAMEVKRRYLVSISEMFAESRGSGIETIARRWTDIIYGQDEIIKLFDLSVSINRDNVGPAFVEESNSMTKEAMESVLNNLCESLGCSREDAQMLMFRHQLLFGGTSLYLTRWIQGDSALSESGGPSLPEIYEEILLLLLRDCLHKRCRTHIPETGS